MKVDLHTPEERQNAILRALGETGCPMSKYDIRGWISAYMKMQLTDVEFQANARILMRTGKIIVSRTNQEFFLVK
jgi:hypothetical protein